MLIKSFENIIGNANIKIIQLENLHFKNNFRKDSEVLATVELKLIFSLWELRFILVEKIFYIPWIFLHHSKKKHLVNKKTIHS